MTEVMHKGSDSDTSPLKATAAATTTNRRAIRGRAAALLANNDSSSDSDDNSAPFSKSKPTAAANSKGKSQSSGGGIYYQVLNQTKKEIKENHLKLDAIVDSMKLNEKEKSAVKKASDSEENDDFAQADDEPWVKKKKSQNKQEEAAIPPSPPSPPSPPPPSFLAASKSKRKSTNKLDKQLKELEQIADSKSKVYDILNSSDRFNDDDDDIFNRITVKVLTKDGVCTIETNKNESFSKVYDELAKKLKTPADSIVLMLKERVINIQDTPSSIGLKIYDIIDCGKVTSKKMVQEKIQVVNDENDESEPPANCIRVIFQTEEGRKSRIKFLILKTETFDNVLKKYCEKRNLSAEDKYLLEFDGERVDLSETPVDLDLDGDEIFDVKKGSKSIMQKVAANQKAYEYDDDILPL